MRLLAAAALALLVGCVEPDDPSFDIDSGFSDADVGGIVRAMGRWNKLTIPSKRMTLDRPSSWRIERRDPGTGFNGECLWPDRVVLIRPGSDAEMVFLHEGGHVLDLGHVPDGTGVMSKSDALPDFTEADMAECRRAGACE